MNKENNRKQKIKENKNRGGLEDDFESRRLKKKQFKKTKQRIIEDEESDWKEWDKYYN